jgi:hypothetical protein
MSSAQNKNQAEAPPRAKRSRSSRSQVSDDGTRRLEAALVAAADRTRNLERRLASRVDDELDEVGAHFRALISEIDTFFEVQHLPIRLRLGIEEVAGAPRVPWQW